MLKDVDQEIIRLRELADQLEKVKSRKDKFEELLLYLRSAIVGNVFTTDLLERMVASGVVPEQASLALVQFCSELKSEVSTNMVEFLIQSRGTIAEHKNGDASLNGECQVCGKPITSRGGGGGMPRVTCGNPACQEERKNQTRHTYQNRAPDGKLLCRNCLKPFKPSSGYQKICSPKCCKERQSEQEKARRKRLRRKERRNGTRHTVISNDRGEKVWLILEEHFLKTNNQKARPVDLLIALPGVSNRALYAAHAKYQERIAKSAGVAGHIEWALSTDYYDALLDRATKP